MSKYNKIIEEMDNIYHNKKFDQDRIKIHDSIIDSYFENKTNLIQCGKTNKRNIIFMAGSYHAGKSYIISKMYLKNIIDETYIYIDIDQIRTKLPEYNSFLKDDKWTMGEKTNYEAKYISEIIQRKALNDQYNILIDGSQHNEWCSDVFIPWIKCRYPTYTIYLIYVKADWDVILERSKHNSNNVEYKRCIPIDIVKNIYDKMPESIKRLKLVVEKIYEIENNTDKNNVEKVLNIMTKDIEKSKCELNMDIIFR